MLIPPAGLGASLLRLLRPEQRRAAQRALDVVAPGTGTALGVGESALIGAEHGLRTIARGGVRLAEFLGRQFGADTRTLQQIDQALQIPTFLEEIPRGPSVESGDNPLTVARKVWHFMRDNPEEGARWLSFQVGQSLPVTAAVAAGTLAGGVGGAALAIGSTALSSAGEVGGERLEAKDLPLIALHAGIEYLSDVVVAAAGGIGLDDAAKQAARRYVARLAQRFPTLSVDDLTRLTRRFVQGLAVAGTPLTEAGEEALQSGIESLSRGEGFKVDPLAAVTGALVGGVLGPGAAAAGAAVRGVSTRQQPEGDGAALPEPAIPPTSPFVQRPTGPMMEEVPAPVAAREIPFHLYVPDNARLRRAPDSENAFVLEGRTVGARIEVQPSAPNESVEQFIPRVRDEGTFEVAPGKIVRFQPLADLEGRLDAATLETTPIKDLVVEGDPEAVAPEYRPLINVPKTRVDVDELSRLPLSEALKHPKLFDLYFSGAPPVVKTIGDLANLARHVARLAVFGHEGRFWYDRSSMRLAKVFNLPLRIPSQLQVELTPQEQAIAEYLSNAGDQARLEEARRFVALLAAFSPQTPPPDNWANAVTAYTQYLQQKRLNPNGPFKLDVGSAATPIAEKVLNAPPGTEEQFLNQKTRAFYRNLMSAIEGRGEESVTTDLWVFRALGYPKTKREAPTPVQFAFAQRLLQDVAGALGWTPMQVQAALWVAERTLFNAANASEKAFDLYRRLQEGDISWREFEQERARLEREALNAISEGGTRFVPRGVIRSDDFADVVDTRSLQFSLEAVRGWRDLLRPDTPYEVYEQFTREVAPLVDQTLREIGLDAVSQPAVLPGYWGGTDFNPSIQVRLYTPSRFAGYQKQFLNSLLSQQEFPRFNLPEGLLRSMSTKARAVYKKTKSALKRTATTDDQLAEGLRQAIEEFAAQERDETGRAEFVRYVARRAMERAGNDAMRSLLERIAESPQPLMEFLRLQEGLVTSEESAIGAQKALDLFHQTLWEETKRWFEDPYQYPVDSGGVAEFWTRIAAVVPPEMQSRLEVAAGVLNMIFDQQAIGWHLIHPAANPGLDANGLHIDLGRAPTRQEILQIDAVLTEHLGTGYGWIGSREEGLFIGLDEDRISEIRDSLNEKISEILAALQQVYGDQVEVRGVLALTGLSFNPQLREADGEREIVEDSEAIAEVAARWTGLSAGESVRRVTGLVARGRAAAARILLDRYGDYLSEEGRKRAEYLAEALSRGVGPATGAVPDVSARPGPSLDVDVGPSEEAGGGGYRDVAAGWQDLPVGARVHTIWRRLGYTVPGGGMAEILRVGKERLIDAFGLRTAVERRHFSRLIDAFEQFARIDDEKEYQILLSSIDDVLRPSGMELIGQPVTTWRDLVRLLAVYRNPHIEIGRLLIVDMDSKEIIHELATTAWSPVYTWVAMGGFDVIEAQLDRITTKIKTWHGFLNELLNYYAEKEGRKRVGVIYVHNHPSGNPNASDADKSGVRYLASTLGPRFLGAVVIDTGEATVLLADENDVIQEYRIKDPKALPPLYKELDDVLIEVMLEEQIRRRRDAVTFIVTRPHISKSPKTDVPVVGIVSMHPEDFRRKVMKNPRRELKRLLTRFGGWNLIVFGPDEFSDTLKAWEKEGLIGLAATPRDLRYLLVSGITGVRQIVREAFPGVRRSRSILVFPGEEEVKEDEGANLYMSEDVPDEDDLVEASSRMTPGELANPARRPDVRQVVHQVDRVMRDLMDYPDPETFEEWDTEGQRLLRNPRERQRIEAGEIYSPADVMAAKRLIDQVGAEALSRAYRGDTSELDRLINVVVGYRVARTEIARALAAGRDPVRGPAERWREFALQALTQPTKREKRLLNRLLRAEERQGVLTTIRERALRTLQALQAKGIELDKVDWSNPLEAAHVIREIQAVRSEWSEKIYEYWINAILSSPSTHLVNFVSNLLTTSASLVIERPLQAMINDLFIKDPELPTLGELPIIYKAVIKKALPIALYRARLAFKSELGILDDEITGGTRSKTEFETVAIGGTVGRIVRIPKRLLIFADEIFKNLAFYAQKAALLYRAGKAYELSGRDLERFVWEGMDEDTTGIDQAAYQFALKQVYQEDVPPIIKSVIRFRRDHMLFRYLFPFLVTPTNVFRRAVRYTFPGTIILAWRLARRNISREEALERVVQNAIGWFVFWTIWMLSSGDDDDPGSVVITGSTSVARGERDLAYRARPPRSIRIGGKWWSYSRLDPIATVLQVWVDTVDAIRAGIDDPEVALKRAWEATTGVVTDKTFLATLDDLALLPLDPGGTVLRMVQRYSTSFVPALLRSAVRASDTVLRDTRPSREGVWWTRELFEKAFRGALAPWTLQPRVDLWGRPIRTKVFEAPVTDFLFRLLTPVQAREVDVHPADIVLLRWNQQHPREQYHPVLPDREFTYRGRTFWMPDDVYHKFLVTAGRLAAVELAAVFKTVPERPTRDHIEVIERTIERARRMARRAILYEHEPELLELEPE